MKLFKKVLAVVLVGAMAVSMLTACGSASKTTKVKNALKNVGVKQDAAMVADTEKAMAGLQKATEAYSAETDATRKNAIVTALSGNNGGTGSYDLYIWTNNSTNRKDPSVKYPYLMKVTNKHVQAAYLPALLDENFVKKGEFKGTSADMDILKKLLKGIDKAGVSCEKVYGYDVLLVTVPKDSDVSDTKLNTTTGTGTRS